MARTPYSDLYEDLLIEHRNLLQKHLDLHQKNIDLANRHISLQNKMIEMQNKMIEIATAVLSAKQTLIGDEKYQHLLEWMSLAMKGKLDGTC